MFDLILQLVAPRACGSCGAWVEGDAALCLACAAACSPAPTPPALLTAPRFASGAHVDTLRDAVLAWKTAPRPSLTRPLALRLVAAIPVDWRTRIRTVVPVPDHPRRTRARGFDPVARLATVVARELGAPAKLDALGWRTVRARQARLDAQARFSATKAIRAFAPIEGPVLVVDDVSTTGATLQGAIHALAEIGIHDVATACVSATPLRHAQQTES